MRTAIVLALLAATATLAILVGWGRAGLAPPFGVVPLEWPSLLLVAAGAVLGGFWTACGILLRKPGGDDRSTASEVVGVGIPVLAALSAGGIALGVAPSRAVVCFALSAGALLSSVRCAEALARGEPVGWRTHWGGLGGGGSGFTLLPATMLALLSLVLGAAAIVLGTGAPELGAGPPTAARTGADANRVVATGARGSDRSGVLGATSR